MRRPCGVTRRRWRLESCLLHLEINSNRCKSLSVHDVCAYMRVSAYLRICAHLCICQCACHLFIFLSRPSAPPYGAGSGVRTRLSSHSYPVSVYTDQWAENTVAYIYVPLQDEILTRMLRRDVFYFERQQHTNNTILGMFSCTLDQFQRRASGSRLRLFSRRAKLVVAAPSFCQETRSR
jgi:hypothetical protein